MKSKVTDTVSEVCSKISLLFEDCLEYDMNTYTEHCPSAAAELLDKQVLRTCIGCYSLYYHRLVPVIFLFYWILVYSLSSPVSHSYQLITSD